MRITRKSQWAEKRPYSSPKEITISTERTNIFKYTEEALYAKTRVRTPVYEGPSKDAGTSRADDLVRKIKKKERAIRQLKKSHFREESQLLDTATQEERKSEKQISWH